MGAITGDIAGSLYEFNNIRSRDFEFLSDRCHFTDDTVMTVAVCDALLDCAVSDDDDVIRERIINSLKYWGKKYPFCGFGGRFFRWVLGPARKPYGSCGNGSAMRVSPAGWLFDDIDTVRRMARLTADVTHSHPEGIKGAEAVACLIYLSRTGAGKEQLKKYVTENFGYSLDFTCDGIRDTYCFDATCQNTVPQAIVCFLEAGGFEDTVRNGVSIGGDTDTICAVAGSIAEAFYGISGDIREKAYEFLDDEMIEVICRFNDRISGHCRSYMVE